MTYTPYYSGGWKNLPDTSTPIWAAALAGFDQGILDAQAAAAAAQATADSAVGSSGGGVELITGLHLDGVTDDGPKIQDALDAVGDGTRGAHLLIHGNAKKVCYINSIVQMQTSNTILDADVGIKLGPLGQVKMFGAVLEFPATSKPALTADSAAGSNTVTLNNIAPFSVGDYCGMRGNRDSSGKPLQIVYFTITAINVSTKTLTFDPPLTETYLKTNPTSWSNKLSQVTRVESSFLSADAARGDVILEVESSAPFDVGTFVQVTDDTHTLDGDGTIQDGNYAHKEQALVVDIPDATHVQIDHALFHAMDHTKNARVQVLNGIFNSEVRNWNCTFQGLPTGTWNAFEARFCYNSGFRHLKATGTPGNSWLTQAFRLTDCYASYVDTCSASGASDVDAAHGYGATFYGSTSCWIRNSFFSGCRHSVLWFNGAVGNTATDCISVGARISDFDWHGAECLDNLAIGCTATGGYQKTTDSDHRTAFKWGNPSHRPGDGANMAIGCKVVNYLGVAIEGIPTSGDVVWKSGEVRGADIGIMLGPITGDGADTTQLIPGWSITESDFWDVKAPLAIDGGAHDVVTRFLLDNNRWHRCGPLQLISAPGAIVAHQRILNPTGTGHQIMAWDCSGIQVKSNDLSNGPKGIAITSSPNARVTSNTLHDLGGAEFHDGGGNTGWLVRSNEIFPGTGTMTRTGTASSSATIQSGIADGGTFSIGSPVTGGATGGGTGGGSGGGGGGGGGGGTTVMPLVGRSGKPWNSGVARWNASNPGNPALADAFGTWRGRPVDGFLNFPPRDSWANMFLTPSDWSSWPGYIVNSLPSQPEPGNDSVTATGANDSHWSGYGTTLAAAGLNTSHFVLRLNWECNGYWFKWSYGDENGSQSPQNSVADFVNAVKKVSVAIKSTAPNILISVCLNRGSTRGGVTWQSIFDQLLGYIDIIGLDHYDWYPGQSNSSGWASALSQNPGFNTIATYCRANGLLISCEEWGLISATGGSAGGGAGDDPYFIARMHDMFSSLSDILAFEGYYEDSGADGLDQKMMTGTYPNAAAAYRDPTRWGT